MTDNRTTPLCPNARPEWADSKVFGVVTGTGTVKEPHVTYLNERQPVTDELMALCEAVTPTEVFRIAAPCASKGCQNFDGTDCRLAKRIVQHLPGGAEELPPCSIRQDCRWWQQEGKAACMRCPQVVTDKGFE
nr:nitrogen fixation protein [Coleofasciculus sp. FACHB-1120]